MPKITKTLFAGSFLFTLAAHFGLLSPWSLILDWQMIWYVIKWSVWTPHRCVGDDIFHPTNNSISTLPPMPLLYNPVWLRSNAPCSLVCTCFVPDFSPLTFLHFFLLFSSFTIWPTFTATVALHKHLLLHKGTSFTFGVWAPRFSIAAKWAFLSWSTCTSCTRTRCEWRLSCSSDDQLTTLRCFWCAGLWRWQSHILWGWW